MAHIISGNGVQHLQGHTLDRTLCGALMNPSTLQEEGVMTCPECGRVALEAIAGTTKKERKEWRTL